MDFSANIARFTGFAGHYDRFRPSPPEALAGLLTQVAQGAKPVLVVDLGCGTGLSTRYWAGRAVNVVGVEPTAAMREQAESLGGEGVSYREGFSHATGLPSGSADIVTCSQSLHWMDPLPTFEEAGRILRPGGVFAASDYDWPPVTTSPEADAFYLECVRHCHQLEKEHNVSAGLKKWEKEGHLLRMRESGCFRFTRECLLHHQDAGNAERLVGLLLSQGHVRTLLKAGFSEADLHIDRLREEAGRLLGEEMRTWFWGSRVRLGVKGS